MISSITTDGNILQTGITKVLIALPAPENEKSSYYDLVSMYNIELHFHPFISVESISAQEFKAQKIDILKYTAVIFTSRHTVDNFFRICQDLKIKISDELKYFCVTEAIALYLQNFIVYKKRKTFFGADGKNKSFFELLSKHKDNEQFLYPCSDTSNNEIKTWLVDNHLEFASPVLFKIVSNDIREVIAQNYDIICLYNPASVKSLLENFPLYKQNATKIGVFGTNTLKLAEDEGLKVLFAAHQLTVQSMIGALKLYFSSIAQKQIPLFEDIYKGSAV